MNDISKRKTLGVLRIINNASLFLEFLIHYVLFALGYVKRSK